MGQPAVTSVQPGPISAAEPPHGGDGTGLLRLGRKHWVLVAVVTLALILRAWYCIAVVQPVWYIGDSIGYVNVAASWRLPALRPYGYPLLLAALRPLHSLLLVAVLQHVLGVGVGLLVHRLARKAELPAWLAGVAAGVPILEGVTLSLEHTLLAEALFTTLVTAAVVLLWDASRTASWWQPFVALILLSSSATVRTIGLPLGLVALVVLLFRRIGWARLVVAVVGFALPLTLYAGVNAHVHGRFGLSQNSGFFLYGRVAPFADCRAFSVPSTEAPLCENTAASTRRSPSFYLFNPSSPLQRLTSDEQARDRLGGDFARRVIEHQPLGLLHAVAVDLGRQLTARPPGPIYKVPSFQHLPVSALGAKAAYGDHSGRDTRVHGSQAGLLADVQRRLSLPGLVHVLLLVVGLLGALFGRDRAGRRLRGRLALPLALAATLLFLPLATAGFDLRYLAPALPLLALAGAIGFDLLRRRLQHGRGREPSAVAAA